MQVNAVTVGAKQEAAAVKTSGAGQVMKVLELCCLKLDTAACNVLSASVQGVDFFAKEHARLQRMMGSGSVAEAKLQEMLKKTSVLSSFLPAEEEKAAEV